MEIKEPKTAEEIEAEQEALMTAYQMTFNSSHGKKVLKDLRKRCWFDRATFYNEDNREMILYREGMRNVYLGIRRQLELERD